MSPHQNPYNNMNFWDFVQNFDPNQATGRGVDHQSDTPFPSFMAGFPFGGPGVGAPGPNHGRPHGPPGPPPPPEADGFVWGPWFAGENAPEPRTRQQQTETQNTTTKSESRPSEETLNVSDPEEVAPEENQCGAGPEWPGRGRGRGRGGPRCGRGGRGRGPFPHHGPPHGPHHGPHPPPPPPYAAPFDFSSMFRGWASHPFFRNMRDQFQESQNQNPNTTNESSDSSFNPPIDVFNTEKSYVIHVALPGAKKEDIGVNWDAARKLLKIAGVVHRPGDEAFLNSLASGERKVGMFERSVTLPPAGADERDEVDGLGITAKMEDGVLIITVPKAEKEWTEIHKIDIE